MLIRSIASTMSELRQSESVCQASAYSATEWLKIPTQYLKAKSTTFPAMDSHAADMENLLYCRSDKGTEGFRGDDSMAKQYKRAI